MARARAKPPPRSSTLLSAPQRGALAAIATALVAHLEGKRRRGAPDDEALDPPGPPRPELVQIDGPGGLDLVELLARSLLSGKRPGDLIDEPPQSDAKPARATRPDWTVVRFDAWQYQRVAPPWWWLVWAFDRQLREDFRARGRWVARRKRLHDYGWRLGQFLADLRPVILMVLLGALLWYVSGRLSMGAFLKWALGLIGGFTTLGAFLLSATNGLRRLFLVAPTKGGAVARTTDPMTEVQARYSFLTRLADSAVVLVIDNLDRCRADYVVELLEGIETVLWSPTGERKTPFVAVLVPAERAWLCESYVRVYEDFRDVMHEPGRPFGLGFVERVFDVGLRLPRVAIVGSSAALRAEHREIVEEIGTAACEHRVRHLVAEAERKAKGRSSSFRAIPALRLAAVERLGELDAQGKHSLCQDSEDDLDELLDAVVPGPTVTKQLRTAYCVQRTRQLLGGHPIDDDLTAIHRLGLWTILDLRWPDLAHHLARHPDDVKALREQRPPADAPEDLEEVFTDSEASRLVYVWRGAPLTAPAVRRFSSAPGDGHRTDSKVVQLEGA